MPSGIYKRDYSDLKNKRFGYLTTLIKEVHMHKRKNDDFDIDLPQFSPFEMVLGEARYILLYGEICDESAREINTKLIAMAIKSPKKPIVIEINSGGGSVPSGIAIMNTIQTIPCPVVTIINGEADSMAGFISVVADKRLITPVSYWMGHPISDGVCGNPQTIKDRGLYLMKLENDLRDVFKNKTKLTEEEFQKMLRGELWLNPKECLEKGIVDECIEIGKRAVRVSKEKDKYGKKGKK